MDLNSINILVYAYIGDSIYELMIREYLINKGYNKVNKLQTLALNYVTAKNQAKFITYLLDNNILMDDEIDIVKRGRNAKVYSHPKNTDILTYKHATSLECLFGYLYIKKDMDRINELIRIITEV
ncbi:MAG: ribonuclease III [Bacilli bacterium]|nr:ribonuclease III [Bacilli bacterium]